MAKTRLTGFSKLLITLGILALIFFGGKYLLNNTGIGQTIKDKAEVVKQEQANKDAETNDGSASDAGTAGTKLKRKKGDDVLRVQLFTWGGYAPGLYFNKGWQANTSSMFYKDYGLKVEFVLIDDFPASRQAWAANQVDLIGATADAFPAEMAGLGKHDPQMVMQVDWSRGGDALIAQRGINSINDLKGKRIAVAPLTPSFTFLIKSLEAADLTLDDVILETTNDNIASATIFKAREVDAAVVWAPDDEVSVREVPGAKILQTTKTASNIIADVFIAKKSFVRKNQDKLNKFYQGWMRAAAELNSSPTAYNAAAKILANGTFYTPEDAKLAMDKAYFTTHGDNMNFYKKNANYKGVTIGDLYSEMTTKFRKYDKDFPARIPRWQEVANASAVLAADPILRGPEHAAEKTKIFTAPTKSDISKPAIAKKPISINFATARYQLSASAKDLIDIKMGSLLKSFANSRIRIEGNTDDVGQRAMNMELSKKRANAVAQYLMNTYGLQANQLIVVGNGPDKPVAGCENMVSAACRAKNRRTEFQLIQ